MRKDYLKTLLHPFSQAFTLILVLSTVTILFSPTLIQLISITVIDLTLLMVIIALDKKIYPRLFPETRIFFPTVNREKLAKLTDDQKISLLDTIFDFPSKRTSFIFLVSIIKVTIVGIIIVYFWDKQGESYSHRWIKFITLEFVTMIYYYTLTYIDLHKKQSRQIAEFHRKYNWENAILNFKPKSGSSKFILLENLSLSMLAVSIVALIAISAQTVTGNNLYIPKLITISTLGIMALALLHYQFRTFFMNGLYQIFTLLRKIDYKNYEKLPLHTANILATFETTFNGLVSKLEKRDRELENWLIHNDEQSKFNRLGEMTGLITHDLVGPLHTIQFCSEELKQISTGNQKRYLDQIDINIKRSYGLITSMLAQIKNPDSDSDVESSLVMDAYSYTLQLLKSQFADQGIEKIEFYIDPSLHNTEIPMPRADLIHIFYNVIKNSIENLLDNNIRSPRISVIKSPRSDKINISIHDNGTGLSMEDFNEMTAQTNIPRLLARRGMGLRLTRRLIERSGGTMAIKETDNGSNLNIELRAVI